LAPPRVAQVVREMAEQFKNPPKSVDEVLEALERRELVQSVAELRKLLLSS
jgi:DNA-binding transcriptional regulator YhcF (GntR family)